MPQLEDGGVALESFPSALPLVPLLCDLLFPFLSLFFVVFGFSLSRSLYPLCVFPLFSALYFLSFSFCFSSEKIPPPLFSCLFLCLLKASLLLISPGP
jgi:hypothetical protein